MTIRDIVKMKNTGYCILVLVAIHFFSCSDDKCNLETDTLLKTELLVQDQNLNQIKYIDSLSVYSDEWTDSIHYSKEGSNNSIFFMLSPNSDTTQIIITSTVVELNDTIFLYHKRNFVLISPECGFVVNFNIDSLANTRNYIDSVFIRNNEVSTNENGHIQIYF